MTDNEPRSRRSRARLWIGAIIAAAGLGAGVLVWRAPAAQPSPAAPSQPAGVPVEAASATRRNVPVYAHGIGTVQAFNSVTVRARVDGTLMRFAVTEGQEVKQNDLIAVIDPRPVSGGARRGAREKAQDEAQLNNARRDLARYASLARQDFASHQQVDHQQASVDQFTAAVQGDEAAMQTAQLNLSFCYILSPIDGRVGSAAGRSRATWSTPATRRASSRSRSSIRSRWSSRCRRQRCRASPRRWLRASSPVTAYRPDEQDRARQGRTAHAGQRDRHQHRHDQAEGDLRQPRRHVVAGPVRQRPAAASTPRERADRADRARCSTARTAFTSMS